MVRCVNCIHYHKRSRWCDVHHTRIKLSSAYVELPCDEYACRYRVQQIEVKK